MTLDTARAITRALVLGTPAVVGALWGGWDLFVWLRFGTRATESHFIWASSQRHPGAFLLVLLLAAFLFWHFFIGPESPAGNP